MGMILLTGGTGFLGHNFLEQYRDPCHFMGRNLGKGSQLQIQTGHAFIPIDLANDPLPCLKDYKAIVHSSALSSPWGRWEDFYESNVRATRRLIEKACEDGVKQFVHISTPSLYFGFQHRREITECEVGIKPSFANHYARSKHLAEEEVRSHADRIHVTILRPRGIFGKYDTTLFPRLMALGQQRGIPLPGGGEALVDLTHVDNVVHAIRLSLLGKHHSGRAYNISNGEPHTLKELVAELAAVIDQPLKTYKVSPRFLMLLGRVGEWAGALTGREPALTHYTAGLLCYDQTLSLRKAQIELGYAPVRTLRDGLKDYRHG